MEDPNDLATLEFVEKAAVTQGRQSWYNNPNLVTTSLNVTGTVAIAKGGTNAYVAEEILGRPIEKRRYVLGQVLPAGVSRDAAGLAAEEFEAMLEEVAGVSGGRLCGGAESGDRAGYDGAKKKNGSKVHAAVDTLGNRSVKSVVSVNTQDVSAPAQPTGLVVTPNP